MKTDEVLQLLKDFHLISGLRVVIYSTDLNEKFAYPKEPSAFCQAILNNEKAQEKCTFQDANALEIAKLTQKPYIYECHCGLWCAVVPFFRFDEIVGFLSLSGAVVSKADVFEKLRICCQGYFESHSSLEKAIESVLVIPQRKCNSFVSVMTVLAEHIAKSSLITKEKSDLAADTMAYISEHYFEDLSLISLCEKMKCSKSTLMKAFRERYKKSIGEAIKHVRLQNAAKFLCDENASVKSVAVACGFFDQNYFTKVFKKAFGVLPTQYRKNKKDN